MLNYLINEETLTDIANAIRAENDIINLIETNEMSALIHSDENNKVVVINPTTNQEYSNIQIALNKAFEGETIVIQEDISISAIIIPVNVTLDLNGHNINTTYMACYGNIIDSSVENNGILYVPKENFLIQKNNT